MTKGRNQTAQALRCKSLKDVNVNSLKINRNKNAKKTDLQKSKVISEMLSSSTAQLKQKNKVLKSSPVKIVKISGEIEKNTKTSRSTRKCTSRLNRLSHSECKKSQMQPTQLKAIPFKTSRVPKERKLKNDKSLTDIDIGSQDQKYVKHISPSKGTTVGSNALMQNPQKLPNSTRKCFIRLSRLRQSIENDSPTHSSPNYKSLKKQRYRSEHDKENVKGITEVGHLRLSRSVKSHESQIDIKTKSSKFAHARIKSSTPLKQIASLPREPFKLLNFQESHRETEPRDTSLLFSNVLPNITSDKRECLKKLSLSCSTYPFKNLKSVNKSHSAPLRNSTMNLADTTNTTRNVLQCLKPCGNGTNLKWYQSQNSSKECENSLQKRNAKNTEYSLEKSQGSIKNLASRTDLIEQLLLSDNEKEEGVVHKPLKFNETSPKCKKNKFFHSSIKTRKNASSELIHITQPTKRVRLSRKKRLTHQVKNSIGSVYEFLSQSQTSDSEKEKKQIDPAADIIKKLIKEGKVRVATHKKGTGKLIMKRQNFRKQHVTKKRKEIKKKSNKVLINNYDSCDDHENPQCEDTEHLEARHKFNPNKQDDNCNPVSPDISKICQDISPGGDTFSNLARSVLISETKKKENKRNKTTYQRHLLEVAQKFVSTPVRKECPPLDKTANISPISSAPQSLTGAKEGNSSPWRANNDTHLPSVFYFSRNSENLPSFSSDYIPSSPKKQKPRYQDLLPEPLESNSTPDLTDNPLLPVIPMVGVKNSQHSSSISSFTSNDSNGENRPPLDYDNNFSTSRRAQLNEINQQERQNIGRELGYRSPLQIIDVVTLPPWNTTKQQFVPEEKDSEISNSRTFLPNGQTKNNKSDLFGFEEFLESDSTQCDILSNEQSTQAQVIENSHNNDLRNRLHHLKNLKPTPVELPSSSASNRIAAVFDTGDSQTTKKQTRINEMLCSTMLSHGQVKEKLRKPNKKDNEDKVYRDLRKRPAELFLDPEPMTSFNENDSLRTYIRPYKRKRKLKNNFVMFLDSDESNDDDDVHQKDHSDTSKELEPEQKKKKQKREQKENIELNSFMNEFNEMCKEVDGYKLIIE